ncbi:hypothetical protein CLG96_12395 [Sphingomonas oleivorans]|uniref:Periplasmic heavy metal sensor n=1 Tax=Sphingomonas oleivorans TaxID=1735121 RepID=A0A2T5FW09_9SPHN|nr:periplasmic heavy metal sensor [Sphingomonas oleivorans]PTQ09949.1 hypothetical protein CLG96_12395 [Sphingomonas oleivorans]
MITRFAALFLALNAGVAIAAPGTPPANEAVQSGPAPAPVRRVARIAGLSDAGNAVVQRIMGQADPEIGVLARRRSELNAQFQAAIAQPTIDIAQIEALMRQEETLQDEARARTSGRVLALLKELPEADRGPFLRALRMPGATGVPRPAGTQPAVGR